MPFVFTLICTRPGVCAPVWLADRHDVAEGCVLNGTPLAPFTITYCAAGIGPPRSYVNHRTFVESSTASHDVHAGSCGTVNVCPATMIVPDLAFPGLPATLNITTPLPAP